MKPKITTVAKLEAALCKSGINFDGVLPIDPHSADEGQPYYHDVLMMTFDSTGRPERRSSIDFYERTSEDKVEMNLHVPADRLPEVAAAIAATHGCKSEQIGVTAIVTVTTAVAVCKALQGK